MKIVKYDKAKDIQVNTPGGGSGGSSSTTIEGGSATLDRTIWGKHDTGEDIDGSMIINGNVEIKVIEENWEQDSEGDDGEDEEYETGGGNLTVEEKTTTKNLDVTESAYIAKHLYINHSHDKHDTDKKCVSEILKKDEDDIKKNAEEIEKLKNEILPVGSIIMYNGGSAIPENWHICDGTDGTPNLIDKFIKGGTSAGETGGKSEISIPASALPKHSHTFYFSPSGWFVMSDSYSLVDFVVDKGGSSNYCLYTGNNGGDNYSTLGSISGTTSEAGTDVDSEPTKVNIEPPYYTLIYIIKVK